MYSRSAVTRCIRFAPSCCISRTSWILPGFFLSGIHTITGSSLVYFPWLFCYLWGSVAQSLARRTRYPAVAGSIPTTDHVVIALGKQFTCISSDRQLKCIDYEQSAPNPLRYCNALKYELSLLWCAMMACRGKDVRSA